jgi:hypothetical protein
MNVKHPAISELFTCPVRANGYHAVTPED